MMDSAALLFFQNHPGALPLYEAFLQALLNRVGPVEIRVQKTQITFSKGYNFACVSLLPVRRAQDRPRDYITVTFGLDAQKQSPRIDAAVQAAPNRWTHHALIGSQAEIDQELLDWVAEAYAFAQRPRKRKTASD